MTTSGDHEGSASAGDRVSGALVGSTLMWLGHGTGAAVASEGKGGEGWRGGGEVAGGQVP